MLWSNALIPTQKESPADAVAPSHVLLLRAGMIRQLGAGTYTYLPLGLRVLKKAERIVREEMDDAGALELLMPAMHPIELWEETGRVGTMGEVLIKFDLGGDRKVCLGPTHEEVITDLARAFLTSYRQLPITAYQIQTKFRNEPRPRFGIVRTREFLMKDAYSFGADVEQLNASYEVMYEAYCRIFDRCGLPYVAVEAESGPIGGDASHEFMVPSPSGEDQLIHCGKCGYAANVEKAEVGTIDDPSPAPGDVPPPSEVETPGKRTIEEVASFLKVSPEETGKLLVFLADGKPVAVLVRGDHEANEGKVRRAFGASTLEPADAAAIQKATGAPMGFLGPVDLKLPMVVDQSVAAMPRVVVGGNKEDVHLKDVVPGRDFPLDRVLDLRNALAGDPCPRCGATLEVGNGIEIGHVFKLGTKYSDAMGAMFQDAEGKTHPLIMGCYGIGVNRIVASAVEAGNDKNGIIWPLNLAPYEVLIVPLQVDPDGEVMAKASEIAEALKFAGADVLIDDRDQRPGPKFKDADLIGVPLRVVVGDRGLKEGKVELKWRHEAEASTVPAEGAGLAVVEKLIAARQAEDRRVAQRAEQRAARQGQSA
ncbi:proline--tRNA ligase [Tautonia plasticadhaerens]|uniref:Proline--tRNA ligase n=1 Tax=Tautonia plasticadhaerens TaxID=2527974 RepID=A0A518GVT3_9BACT|nr:proline--tRNA ligase [Tautonia plasticadhaerens]QDV32707.1 Proline--tRNA ligase [Tautonia plasticadhaerens]